MQGLAFAEQKPLVGVSGFDALAHIAGAGRVATWVDAWRGEVFAALYEGRREVESPLVSKPERLLVDLKGRGTVFIGDGALAYWDDIHRALGADARLAEPPAPALAGTIAVLACDAASRGEAPLPDAIRPLYVRRTDAEMARDARALR
jgi:tRNA A37 threonylcarbamoyladenosine modification protein TsaB